jgi:branched-chain amino acid transport system ATP-binding protein
MTAAAAAVAPALLEAEGLEVVYNRVVTAIQGISLQVQPGSITGVIGTNGAGKTTTLRAIAGFLPAEDVELADGRITFRGRRVDGRPPHVVARAGIGLIPERNKIFSTLTVEENLRAGIREASSFGLGDAYELFPVLGERRRLIAGYLSGGERQMLAIAMGLVGGPTLMLVDEMSLGLSPAVVAQIVDVIRHLREDRGLSFLLVEQNALLAVDLVDYAYVMENGRIVFEGTPHDLIGHDDFREFYLGLGSGADARSYRDVKEYRRKRRWFG